VRHCLQYVIVVAPLALKIVALHILFLFRTNLNNRIGYKK